MVSGTKESEIRNAPEAGEWVSRNDYMERTGTGERTLTGWIKNGTVKSRLIDIEINGRHKKQRQVFLPAKKNDPDEVPENSGVYAGSNAGSFEPDPETNFQQARKFSVVNPVIAGNQTCEECLRKEGKIDLLEEQLKAVEIAKGRLEGQFEGLEKVLAERERVIESLKDTIKAKEQSVSATQAAYLQLQESNQQLKDRLLPEMAASVVPDSSGQAKKTGWLAGLFGR